MELFSWSLWRPLDTTTETTNPPLPTPLQYKSPFWNNNWLQLHEPGHPKSTDLLRIIPTEILSRRWFVSAYHRRSIDFVSRSLYILPARWKRNFPCAYSNPGVGYWSCCAFVIAALRSMAPLLLLRMRPLRPLGVGPTRSPPTLPHRTLPTILMRYDTLHCRHNMRLRRRRRNKNQKVVMIHLRTTYQRNNKKIRPRYERWCFPCVIYSSTLGAQSKQI